MATRSELKAQLRAMLGLSSDDPLASDVVLNPILNWAYQGVVAEIADLAPDALWASGTIALTALSGSTVAGVYQIRSLRDTDAEGTDLVRVPRSELPMASNAYALTGVEAPFTVRVSADVTTSTLYYDYTQAAGGSDLIADSTVPALVPTRFHDVIALEALFSAELGGEQTRPAALRQRHQDRKAQLFAYLVRVAGPGTASRTRMVVGQGEWP